MLICTHTCASIVRVHGFLAHMFAEVKDLAVRYLLVEFILESAPQILLQVRRNGQRCLGFGGVPLVMPSGSLLLPPRPKFGAARCLCAAVAHHQLLLPRDV